ncbi:MAG: GNAT family N-acetyltransferase [Mycobacteriales bacterium]
MTRDPEALLLAVVGTEIVGSVIAGWDGWRTHLYRVAVREDWRRRGISRALMARAEERFAAAGSRRADAMVLEDNRQGQAAWGALGYAPEHEWRRWVKRLAVQAD